MIRLTALLTVAATALAVVASIGAAPAAQTAPVKLKGLVGPGETIVLKKGASKVSSLKRGRYTFVVSDKSSEHNFRLRGPVSRQITSISATGTKTITLTLKPGRYTYLCDPHAGNMVGSFRVK